MTDLMPAAQFLALTFVEATSEEMPRETIEAACNLFAAISCALAEDAEAVRGYLARIGGPAERALAREALLLAARLAAEDYSTHQEVRP